MKQSAVSKSSIFVQNYIRRMMSTVVWPGDSGTLIDISASAPFNLKKEKGSDSVLAFPLVSLAPDFGPLFFIESTSICLGLMRSGEIVGEYKEIFDDLT